MTSVKGALALYLDAPLQSWGYQSRFDRRTTLSFPTRSGVIGLICAAIGIDREDRDALSQFRDIELKVYCLCSGNRLDDFHTVGGGYDQKSQKQNIVRTAEGKVGNTVVTRRSYLQDSRFCVLLYGQMPLLNQIAEALENPKWGIWLGRKACIPASPVFQGFFESDEAALKKVTSLAEGNDAFRVIHEVPTFDEGSDTLMDEPVEFRTREFAPRRVSVEPYDQ